MASQVTNYKCPACTGPLHFVGESGKLECDFCGSKFDVAEIEAQQAKKEQQATAEFEREEAKRETGWDDSAAGEDWGADAQGMKAYNCPSCGAQLMCDETTAATSCPYCGNPAIVPGQFGGTKKPDYVIPFRLDKKAAVAALKRHYKGKPLLPKAFTDENHVEELKGVYVPFWLYDARADASAAFHGTRSSMHKEGDYEVTVTSHYEIHRAGTVEFQRVPVDGSSKMPDDYMDSIEPFNYDEMKPFSTAYLPGYLADKYDVTAADAAGRADTRFEQSAVDCLRDTVMGYATVMEEGRNVILHKGEVKYAMLPVWMLTTKWKGQSYLFAMNGQTGKLVGDLPVDKGKAWRWFGGVFVGVTAVLTILLNLM